MSARSAATPADADRWKTPRLLQITIGAIFLAAVLFFWASLAGVRAMRNRVQSIGKDSVPSILAAQRLKVSLADLDANVVNELIVAPGKSPASIKGYVTRRQEITDSLIRAAENITYGDLERKPITDLTNALSAYERLAIKARTLHQRGEERGATATYRDALAQLHGALYPASELLAKANTDALLRQEKVIGTNTAIAAGLTLLTGVLLLGVLVESQVLLFRRTNRLFNPALLAATTVAVVSLGLLLRSFAVAQEQVRIARDDAFVSLSALWQARATAYDANSDESRWLYDRDRRPELEKSFMDKTALLLKLPAGQSYAAMTQATANPAALPADTSGYLAQELGNITFPGEREVAEGTVRAWGVYYAADEKIRALENNGQHEEAVRFCISMAPGDSNWAYAQYDQALDKTIEINQKAFDAAIERGFGAVRGYDVGLPVAVLLVGGLAFAGIRPRLREYDV
ncbi:MAG: MCP four helix bundle domain-containing protein [Fibrella sp.]|nr:MCP four helix bundle domain-containing protein [Armatimonadota bacterium]